MVLAKSMGMFRLMIVLIQVMQMYAQARSTHLNRLHVIALVLVPQRAVQNLAWPISEHGADHFLYSSAHAQEASRMLQHIRLDLSDQQRGVQSR